MLRKVLKKVNLTQKRTKKSTLKHAQHENAQKIMVAQKSESEKEIMDHLWNITRIGDCPPPHSGQVCGNRKNLQYNHIACLLCLDVSKVQI